MKLAFFVLSFLPILVCAQNKPGTQLKIKKSLTPITLDGVLDEPAWVNADVADDWYMNYPIDTASAPFQTEARVSFNDQFFYFSFVCYDDSTKDLINSLRRDFDYERNDNVGINIGPYNDGLNGFFFVLTPAGIQMEGTVSGGGSGDNSYSITWDNKWYSHVTRYKDKWIVEAAIPFKSFRYKSNVSEWNIAFDRSDKKRNHKSAWIQTPIQYPTASFAYSGQLIWEDPIPPAHTNISLIPFIAGNTSTDNEVTPKKNSSDMQVGFDAKIGVTPSMNLDLTVNPDFSQVEVDQQVINLTRFEFRFPERRQFFLENSDLNDNAGFPDSRAFFSRRIGLVRDSSDVIRRVPISYGARLSGSLNKNWRVSLLNMQTKEQEQLGLPAQNYTAATVQRNFWRQSNFAITYVDKETLRVREQDSSKYFQESIFQQVNKDGKSFLRPKTYNRVIDADLELLSKDNKLYSSSFIARSFDPFTSGQSTAGGAFFQYSARSLYTSFGHSFVNANYNAEAGYVPSHNVYPGQLNYFLSVGYKFYPKNKAIVLMGPEVNFNNTYLPGGILSDRDYSISYNFNFINTSRFFVYYNYIFQRLTNTFNPIDSDTYTNFLMGEKYDWHSITANYVSNTRKIVNFNLRATYGEFYNGTNLNLNGQLNYRYQPFGNVSLRFDYNDLKLPENYGREKLFLIGPRLDLTFTNKIFLTTYVQYNNLSDNVNLNARFQWRYKPASDFFIVYTENYIPGSLASKNRALVFKLTYWFNL